MLVLRNSGGALCLPNSPLLICTQLNNHFTSHFYGILAFPHRQKKIITIKKNCQEANARFKSSVLNPKVISISRNRLLRRSRYRENRACTQTKGDKVPLPTPHTDARVRPRWYEHLPAARETERERARERGRRRKGIETPPGRATGRHLGQWENLGVQVRPSGVALDPAWPSPSVRDAFSPGFYVASLVTQVSGQMPPPQRALCLGTACFSSAFDTYF